MELARTREPPTVNDTLRSARHAPLSSRQPGCSCRSRDAHDPAQHDSVEPIEPDESIGPASPSSSPAPELTFADFDVHPDIVASLADAGIIHPFPIQAMTLPVALGGHDIIGQAKTGTGKTLGFGVPILDRVVTPQDEAYRRPGPSRQAAGARRGPDPRARRPGGRRPRARR